MSDTSERTEQATEQHLQKVRREGKLGRSQDLGAWLGLAAAAAVLPLVIGTATDHAVASLFTAASIAQDPDPQAALKALGDGLGGVLPTLGVLLAAVVVGVFAGAVLQGGIRFRSLKLHPESLDVIKGVTRTFGGQALWNGAKTLLKAGVVGVALWLVVKSLMPALLVAGSHTVAQVLGTASGAVTELLTTAIAAGLVVAGFDVLMVLRRNRKQTMMTRREVKDEMKNNEGDPQVRQHRRSRQLAVARTRMISSVGEASVVLVNPTHYAVALKYASGASAPVVVAKGAGEVAARIREQAARRGVPLVRDIALTRALHAQVPLGREIPAEFYTAIAQVLAFVALLKRRGAASGVRDNPHASRASRGADGPRHSARPSSGAPR